MTTVITGGAGFIGSHLADRLLSIGDRVICLENFDSFYDPILKWKNIEQNIDNPNYKVVSGNVADIESAERAFNIWGVDTIVHLAAQAGVRPSVQNPLLHSRVNVTGTVNMLELCRKHDVSKFIYISSSSVYGNNLDLPSKETAVNNKPLCPYAATKKASELMCYTYHYLYGIDAVCLRPFTVYGPRQRTNMAIPLFVSRIYNDETITVHKGREIERDFTYVDDVVDGIISTLDLWEGYEIYNLGSGKTTVIHDLVGLIEKKLGKKANIKFAPLGNGEATKTHADISKARKNLGYLPKVDIEDGLNKYIQWFLRDK